MMKKREKIIGSSIIILVFIIFFAVNYFMSKPKNKSTKDIFVEAVNVEENKDKTSEAKKGKLIVEVKGEVKRPEVYVMSEGSIVKDVIIEAGGLTEKGDLSKVNQAKKIRDGECIIIPSIDMQGASSATMASSSSVSSGSLNKEGELVNINTATKEELMKLPGVGEVTAQKIIDYREKNGSFSNIEDLKKVGRIGDKTLEKFKDKIEAR